MSYINLGIIGLTIIALLFGTLFGMSRGRNRAILRLILIVGSIIGAIFLRETISEIIMNIETGEGTVAEMITASMTEGEEALPESMQTLMLAMIEIMFGLVSYFIAFFALRFISWIIIYPICKIFVKKGEKKRRGAGAIIGLVQGIVIAIAVVVPLNGLAGEFSKFPSDEMAIPAEVGLEDYNTSGTYKVYDTIGGWYYDILTTVKTKDGKEINLSATCSAFGSMVEVGTGVGQMGEAMDNLNTSGTTDQEKVDSLRKASDTLANASKSLENLDENSKEMLNDILVDLKDMIGSEGGSTEAFEDISLEKLNVESVAECLGSLATYIEKTEITAEEVTQEDVDKIVNGLANSEFAVDLLIGDGTGTIETIYQVESEDYIKFNTAINLNENLTTQQKLALKKAFGIG